MTAADSVAALADSLRQSLAVSDSLLTVTRESLAVARESTGQPAIYDVRVHDTLGGKDFLTWAVQLVVALGAAYLGARIGGSAARRAATDAIHAEWQMERQHARERLQMRVKSNLLRVKRLSDGCSGHDPKAPLDPGVGEGLEVAWNLYYRVADPIFTMGAGDLAERIDAFFVRCHTLAEKVKAFELRWRQLEVEKASDPRGEAPIGNVLRTLWDERKALLAEVADLGADAEKLLTEVRSLVTA